MGFPENCTGWFIQYGSRIVPWVLLAIWFVAVAIFWVKLGGYLSAEKSTLSNRIFYLFISLAKPLPLLCSVVTLFGMVSYTGGLGVNYPAGACAPSRVLVDQFIGIGFFIPWSVVILLDLQLYGMQKRRQWSLFVFVLLHLVTAVIIPVALFLALASLENNYRVVF